MSWIVDNVNYDQAIRTIREIVLDTNPVQCFKVSGQDFLFKKDIHHHVRYYLLTNHNYPTIHYY